MMTPGKDRGSVSKDNNTLRPMKRERAMKMITVYPSYYVLKEKEVGTLEVGKFADFIEH